MAESLAAQFKRIRELKDGWDGYDGVVLDSTTLSVASTIVQGFDRFPGVNAVSVISCSDGSLEVVIYGFEADHRHVITIERERHSVAG